MAYGKENGVEFIDFNQGDVYRKAGLDYGADMNDSNPQGDKNAHANPAGARKMTNYLGGILQSRYGLRPCKDEQWESAREFNDGVWKDFCLRNETDLSAYLAAAKDERYTVFLAAKEGGDVYAGEEQARLLGDLGLVVPWESGKLKSYFALIEKGEVKKEQMGDGRLYELGAFRDGEVIWQMASAAAGGGYECSIQINRREHAKGQRGLNIVVYSNDTKSVIDSVCFDICSPELTAYR